MRKVRNFDKKVNALVEELADLYSLGFVGFEGDTYEIYVRKNPVVIRLDGTFTYSAVKYPEYEEVLNTVKKYFKEA